MANQGKKKEARFKKQPNPQKEAKYLEPKDQMEDRIVWSFALYDPEIQFPTKDDPKCLFCDMASKMKSYEGFTWIEIINNHHRDHPSPVSALAKFAQVRLKILKQDDIDELWRLRFDGGGRLWGIKAGPVFRVLWWDPNHEVYPCKKK